MKCANETVTVELKNGQKPRKIPINPNLKNPQPAKSPKSESAAFADLVL